MPVARIDDLVLGMVTSPSGFAYLASAVFVRRPLEQLTRADFIGHDGRVADEADFERVSPKRLVTNWTSLR